MGFSRAGIGVFECGRSKLPLVEVEVEVENPTASTQKPHCQYTKTPLPAFFKKPSAGARARVAAQSLYTLVSETRV